MSTLVERETANVGDSSGFAGHPKGLGPLFFTELWERFSYYGMRSILILYMTSTVAQGGLGFDVKQASSIYGWYTMAVYAACIPGAPVRTGGSHGVRGGFLPAASRWS